MNREILFRGKRADNGFWVYGYYLALTTTKGEKLHYIIDKHGTYNPVNPTTIGQYTGLTDMYGKKIFEGDIVESADFDDDSGYGVVQWADGAFQIGNDLFNGTFYDNYRGDEFEVIGNIHDNPELIGGVDNEKHQ